MNLSPESGADVCPQTPAELQQVLEQNSRQSGQQVAPVGGGTTLHLPAGVTKLRTDRLTRVIDYPHRDLTITVEAGLTLAKLREILAKQGQRLPIDAPQADRATLGGLVATNASGPGRFGYGTLRDYVIGISAVDGQGRAFSAGGRVVKNVAGYDLCKMLIGSQGALAVITQLTFKLRPLAPSQQFVCTRFSSFAELTNALETLNTSQTRPVVMEALRTYSADWRQELQNAESSTSSETASYVLCLAYEGTAAETDWQVQTVVKELSPHQTDSVEQLDGTEAASLWDDLTTAISRRSGIAVRVVFRPSQTAAVLELLPPHAAVQWHAGDGIARCLLPSDTSLEQVQTLRTSLATVGSKLWVESAPQDWKAAERLALEPAVLEIHRRIKSVLDPGNHLYADWLED